MNTKTLIKENIFFILAILFIYTLYVFLSYKTFVPPSDSMFYMYAAKDLADGVYQFPTRELPYHHFMRWPVVFSLSFFYLIFGYGYLALSFYNLLFVSGIGITSFLLAKRLNFNSYLSFVISLVALIIPSEIFIPYVRSEPVSVLFCLIIFYILAKKTYRKIDLSLISLLVALSVNATKISIFSFPAIFIFWIFISKDSFKKKFTDMIFSGILSIIFYLFIMFFEYLFSGNFFIQYDVLTWWVLYSNIESKSLIQEMFSYSSEYRFIFGFTKDIIKYYPRFVIFFLLSFFQALYLFFNKKKNIFTDIFFLTGITSYIFFELFGALAMVKINRYIAFPLSCLSIWSLRSYYEFISLAKNKLIPIIIVCILFFAYLFMQVKENNQPTKISSYCYNLIQLIKADVVKNNYQVEDVKLYFEEFSPVGLMEWQIQTKIYSDYFFLPKNTFQEKRPNKNTKKTVTKYFITTREAKKLVKTSTFKKLSGLSLMNPYKVYKQAN